MFCQRLQTYVPQTRNYIKMLFGKVKSPDYSVNFNWLSFEINILSTYLQKHYFFNKPFLLHFLTVLQLSAQLDLWTSSQLQPFCLPLQRHSGPNWSSNIVLKLSLRGSLQEPWKRIGEATKGAGGKVLGGKGASRRARVATASKSSIFSSLRGRQVISPHWVLGLFTVKEIFFGCLELFCLMEGPCWFGTPLQFRLACSNISMSFPTQISNLITSSWDCTISEAMICLTLPHSPLLWHLFWSRAGRRAAWGAEMRRLVIPSRRRLLTPGFAFCLTRYLMA